MRIIKSEWHSVEKRYAVEIDEDIIAEVYPDMDEEDIAIVYDKLQSGEITIDEFIADAMNEGVDLDWDWLDEDDWYTDRKGGYDVTYAADEE